MTKEEILRLAREAGFDEWEGTDDERFLAVIERFASLVAAAEREACAKVCENFNINHQDCNYYDRAMAAVIRSRNETSITP